MRRGRARAPGDWPSWGSGSASSSSADIFASALARSRASPSYLTWVGLLCSWEDGRLLEWAWPSIVFLAFMIPLPWRVENALGPPLQSIATTVSTYLLQTLGFMAFAEGNVIQLNEARIGVVEACSGLSMLITFVALSTAVGSGREASAAGQDRPGRELDPCCLAGQYRPDHR